MDRVAARYGQHPDAVAGQPWVRTLYWFAVLLDSERIEGEIENLKQDKVAIKSALAFHDPKRLWSDHRRNLAALRVGRRSKQLTEDAIAARVARIDAVVQAHRTSNTEPVAS